MAIKLLHAHLAEDDEVRVRFRDEARHAAKVRHHNVVAVLDQDEHDGLPFIVMELVDGASLRDVLRQRTRLSPGEVVALLTAVCAGLSAVHAVGLVHRDIKPENLLHDRNGDVRVADFGIARALDSTRLTPAGTLLGSVQYMAPELVLGRPATFASDQYSLGVVTFEALTGQPPLPADVPMAAALRHAREVVPPPSSVWAGATPALDAAVTTATTKDPEARHPSLEAFLAATRAAAAAAPDAAPGRRGRTNVLPAPNEPTRRRAPETADPAPPQRRRRPGGGRDSTAAPDSVARQASVPARALGSDRSADHPAPAPTSPATAQPFHIRARMSVLAIVALAFTLVPSGAVVSPLLGVVALRRIDRSHGALRGDAIAGLAIVIGLARLAVAILQQL